MKEHYSEADLLETYYMQPGQSMPVMMHLAGCSECAARYERLERKLREAAVCHPPKGEGFWAVQRAAVMSRIRGARSPRRVPSLLRFAAAALLAVVIGGLVVSREEPPPAASLQTIEERIPADPWQAEALQEFGAVVQWESWIAESNQNEGDQPL
ncbi:MAG TPA: hypothetical protein VNA04_05540 [Thermoanaerobaculia bacterium]|nr:hypothetical protein [Thermoanaerobaculia bacterium]